MKIVTPPGFMPVAAGGIVTILPCSGFGPEQMHMEMPAGDHHGGASHSGGDATPCGFDGHAPPSLTTVDPLLLAMAIAFVVGLSSWLRLAWSVPRVNFLRPQLRGPPALA